MQALRLAGLIDKATDFNHRVEIRSPQGLIPQLGSLLTLIPAMLKEQEDPSARDRSWRVN